MILVCGGIKGGVGKTTVATNLAVMRSLSGKDVLLMLTHKGQRVVLVLFEMKQCLMVQA